MASITSIARGVKHVAWGPEPARQRAQSGPLDDFAKCEKSGHSVGFTKKKMEQFLFLHRNEKPVCLLSSQQLLVLM